MKFALLSIVAFSALAEIDMFFQDEGLALLQLRAGHSSDDELGNMGKMGTVGKTGKMVETGMGKDIGALVPAPDEAALARLHKLREAPLYGNVLSDAQVPNASSLDRAIFETQSGNPVTLVAYHKTGYEFSDRLLSLWSSFTGERYVKASHVCWNSRSMNQCTPTSVAPGADLQLVVVPPADFTLPAKAPTIHFVRHPMDIVFSAYRYHKQTPEGWEKLTGHGSDPPSPKCFTCSESDWHTIFGLCSEECGYFDLLQRIPEEEGILVEAVGMRGQIGIMLSNVVAWASDPDVLHLSMAHLAADFDKTMRCVEAFLGARGFGREFLSTLDSLRPSPTDPHVTTDKYDNTHLEKTLLSVSAWASEFSQAGQVLSDLFVRQGLHYDCPVP